MLNKLIELNEKYWQNDGFGAGKQAFAFTDRKSKLIISAPHAVKTFHNGQIKPADLFTGAIVEYVGELCGLSTLIRTAYVDRDYFPDEYVTEQGLTDFFFLDFHGMINHDDFDLAIGTGLLEADAYQKALDIIQKQAEIYQLRQVVNYPHYSGIAGMTAFTARMQRLTGMPQVLQLEVGRDFRDFYSLPDNVLNQTIPFLRAVLKTLYGNL